MSLKYEGLDLVLLCKFLEKLLQRNASRFRDETRSKNSPKKLAAPEGNSRLGSNCPNSKAPENSFEEGSDLVLLCKFLEKLLLLLLLYYSQA